MWRAFGQSGPRDPPKQLQGLVVSGMIDERERPSLREQEEA